MRLLLDTHVVIAMVNQRFSVDFPMVRRLLIEGVATGFVSVASLWEIAIKSRLGKLETNIPVTQIPDFLRSSGIAIFPIDVNHVMAEVQPEPPTRDPFDRLLLAQCQVEGFRLVTVDRALVDHVLSLQI
jgi:PIN domain nuclease of toxin-antitoxin system